MKVQNMKERRSHKKPRSRPYTNGDLNKIIDSLIHPLAKRDASYIVLDTILHAIVEQNPPATIRKFIKYNLPKILDQYEKSKNRSAT
jgi:hypothetical protein